MSGSAQVLGEQGTGKTPSQEVPISLSHAPKAALTRCPVCAWPQFGLQLCGECSSDSHPLLPCQLLVFLQTPAERALLQKGLLPSQAQVRTYSYPTCLIPSPLAACSQAFMLATVWSVPLPLFIATSPATHSGTSQAYDWCSLNIC